MLQTRIGSLFPLESLSSEHNDFLHRIGADLLHLMSGRCALYACLLDMPSNNGKNIAYVPAYTCETVLASYEKAGYTLYFYDVDVHELTPLFRNEDLSEISVLNLCGYYGFSRYDERFLKQCKDQEVTIIQDTTHSIFSRDGHNSQADYWAGSLRKWIGVACGGVAIKRAGPFSITPLQPDSTHLEGRYAAMEYRRKALLTGDVSHDTLASEVFWKTEMRLREMFGLFGSDTSSQVIVEHLDVESLVRKRREHYETVLSYYTPSSQFRAVFPSLDASVCPSHFSWYSEDRERAQQALMDQGIRSTVYWPKPPQLADREQYPHAAWIYDHVMSVQIDQRYTKEDMEYLGKVLSQL